LVQPREVPEEPIEFIKEHVREREVLWTYHVNMRLAGRFISRDSILAAVEACEMVGEHHEYEYLPSYLVLAHHADASFHVLFAADVQGENVRVVTVYRPESGEWEDSLETRRSRT